VRLVDTSVWVDYLRGSRTRATDGLRAMLTDGEEIGTTQPIVMELLAGATDGTALGRLETLTDALPVLSVDPRLDYRAAAAIFRNAQRSGRTVRRLSDCLIAAIALRHGVELVHKDVDFEVIAECVPLDTVSLR
jgi:predicted nucleic acid-binding protein